MAEPGCIEINVYSSCPVGFYRLIVFSMMHLTISMSNFLSDVTQGEKICNRKVRGMCWILQEVASPLWPNECLGERQTEESMCERQGAHITSVWWSDKGFNEDTLTTDCAVLPAQADHCCPEVAAQGLYVLMRPTPLFAVVKPAWLFLPAWYLLPHSNGNISMV